VRIHVLVEGPAEEAWIADWARRLIPGHKVRVYPHQGKGRLLTNEQPDKAQRGVLDLLRATLRGWANTFNPDTDRILVLVDRDEDDASELRQRMRAVHEEISPTRPAAFQVAVMESEAFFLGDRRALKLAWPGADLKLLDSTKPDEDWRWELFSKVIKTSGQNKPAWARAIAPHLGTQLSGPDANRSPSFRSFAAALLQLCGEVVPASMTTEPAEGNLRVRAVRQPPRKERAARAPK